MSSGNRRRSGRKNKSTHHRGSKPESLAGVRPVKSLGQNFLIDEEIIETIVSGSGASSESLVIEIGPGTGALTIPLAERAGWLIAIELDERVIPGLRVKTFSLGNVEILHEDVLEADLKTIITEAMSAHGLKDVRIVGNLPYYITTPIIMKLLETDTGASSITVMMQKEVGDRIAAEPGTRLAGAITYPVWYYSEVNKITDVGRECFYPVPKVDSVVLRMDIREEPPVHPADPDLYFRCIKAGFLHRRKTLLNSLISLGDYDKLQIAEALDTAGIEHERRAESLSMEELARLSDALGGMVCSNK